VFSSVFFLFTLKIKTLRLLGSKASEMIPENTSPRDISDVFKPRKNTVFRVNEGCETPWKKPALRGLQAALGFDVSIVIGSGCVVISLAVL
jgi:hypothetical protein